MASFVSFLSCGLFRRSARSQAKTSGADTKVEDTPTTQTVTTPEPQKKPEETKPETKMTVATPPATVLVTGASGFIAAWACQTLLESGYNVRGTVRTTEKGEYLKKTFANVGPGKFEYAIVLDISKPHAYDEAVSGDLAAVVHIAGPTTFTTENLNEFKAVMVEGTINLLDSIRTCSTTIKRFVYMSSAQALLGKPLTHIYTEDDWNDGAVAAVEADLAATNGQTRYQAGKVMAERAVLAYPKEHTVPWDVVSLIPAWVFGPVVHQFTSFADLNLSSQVFYKHMTEPQEDPNAYASDFIDVRDLAAAVVAALKAEKAGGERFILDAGSYTYQNLYDVLNDEPPVAGVQKGNPDAPKFSFPGAFCNSSKAIETLGVSFRSLRETARDSIASLRERGISA